MIVKNVKDASNETCNCESWINHWEKFSGKKAKNCSVKGCLDFEYPVGAHVISDGDPEIYIIPLCQGHNLSEDELNIYESTFLVPTDPTKTCGR